MKEIIFTAPDWVFTRVACFARNEKMSIDDAALFLIKRVITPKQSVSFCRMGDNTRARGCGCGCVGGDGAAAAEECSGIARVRAAEKAARAARRKAEHDAAVAAIWKEAK